MTVVDYSIWLLQCGYISEFPVSGIFYGAHNAGTMRIPFCYIALKSSHDVFLIDTGYKFHAYGRALAEQYAVEGWLEPAELLGEINVAPADVRAIVVTHAHWDHIGNLDAFPDAQVVLQKDELSRWQEVLAMPHRHSFLRGGLDPSDIATLHRRALDGQLRLVDGDTDDVLPGIDVVLAPETHTPAHQLVVINTPLGSFVATGDCVYSYGNLRGIDDDGVYTPIGTAMGSQTRVLQTYDRVMSLAKGDLNHVVPVHDDEAWTRFPSREVRPGIYIAEITLASGARSCVSDHRRASIESGDPDI